MKEECMKAAVYNRELGAPEIIERPIPEFGDDELLLKPMSVGVCGSEVLSYRLSGPGSFGHEPAGFVERVGKNVKNVKEGDRVFIHHRVPCFTCHYCRRGHHSMCTQYLEMGFDPSAYAEHTRVKARNIQYDTIVLPDHVSFDEGCLIEILSCVWRTMKRAHVYPGDTVMIVGAGFVGAVAVQIAKIMGAGQVFISDLVDFKLQRAKALGAEGVINPAKEDTLESLKKLNGGRKADIVVTIAGSIRALQDGMRLIDKGGTFVQFGPVEQDATLSWAPNDFFYPEISYIPTYSSSPFDTKEVSVFLFDGRIKVDSLITHHFPLSRIAEAMDMKKLAETSLKIIVHPHLEQKK
jgi:L-iditol 2-dehydrogenase